MKSSSKRRPKAKKPPGQTNKIYVLASALEAAHRAWTRLPRKLKLHVARQLVEEHAEELKSQFKDLIAVSYGYRATGKSRKNRTVNRTEPCVGFLVARKFKPRTASEREHRLPSLLLCYAERRGKQVLVAVPTDVESVKVISRPIRAQNIRIRVTGGAASNPQTDFGVLAAVVKLPQGDNLYGLSCFHVLALTAFFGGQMPNNVTVSDDASSTDLGTLSRYVGKLDPNAAENFDVALAQLDPAGMPALQSHVTRNCNSVLADAHDLTDSYGNYTIYGKQNRQIQVGFSKRWRQFPIQYEGIGQVTHPWVIQSEITDGGATVAGDSGSPVLGRQQTQFLGMHIAGDGALLTFMIGAPDLLDATNYGSFSSGQQLRFQTDF
jgi:hypothetical protein